MEKESKLESERLKKDKALIQLQHAANILREMSFNVIDRSITESYLIDEAPFPIVRDRIDGIRATYSKRRGLKI